VRSYKPRRSELALSSAIWLDRPFTTETTKFATLSNIPISTVAVSKSSTVEGCMPQGARKHRCGQGVKRRDIL